MSASSKGLCGGCHRKRTPLYYLSLTRVLCTDCFVADKKTKKALIKNLPEIAEKPAPLGYHNIAGDFYADTKNAEIWCDHIWKHTRMGVLN